MPKIDSKLPTTGTATPVAPSRGDAPVEPAPTPQAPAAEPSVDAYDGSRSLVKPANSAINSLVSASTMVPVEMGLSAPSPDPTLNGVDVTRDSHGATATYGRTHGDTQNLVDLSLGRAVVGLANTRLTDGREVAGSASLTKGYLGLYGSVATAHGDGALFRGGSLALTPDSLGVGGDFALDAGRRTHSVGVLGTVSADRSVSDLGEVPGGRRVELCTSRGADLWLSSGRSAAVLGLGGTFDVDRSKEVTYRTTLSDDAARAELAEKSLLDKATDRLKALGVVADELSVPSLSTPEALAVGDELEVKVSGSLTGGLAVGASGVRVGVQGTVRGDFLLEAKKLSPTQVELTVTPSEVRGLQLFADTGLPLEIDYERVKGTSLRQALVFDLEQPGARQAYLEALSGKLPAGLGGLKQAAGRDGDTLAALVRNEKLPDGVKRLYAEQLETKVHSAGGGLNFGFIERLSGIAGLSARVSGIEEHRSLTTGRESLETEVRGVEKRREVLLSGTETAGISASAQVRVRYDAAGTATREFVGLSLKARFADNKVRGLELNDEVIEPLNEAFGLSISPFSREGRKQSREVTATLNLSAAALVELSRATPQLVERAADEAGLASSQALALVKSLQGLSAEASAEKVQAFVAKRGLAAAGFLKRVLGPEETQLKVATVAGAYTEPVDTASLLALRYPKAIAFGDGADAITTRFKEVSEALGKAREAVADVEDDPLLTDETRAPLLKDLQDASAKLEQLISVAQLTPAERASLHRTLDRGWTTDTEYQLMAHLEAAGLRS